MITRIFIDLNIIRKVESLNINELSIYPMKLEKRTVKKVEERK